MYHKIGPSKAGTVSRSLYVDPGRFESQMRWLKQFGYRGLSMADLLPYLSGEKSGRVFGLTFDDGYRNVLENAAPVLDDIGFTATNYFVSSQIGGSNDWDLAKNIPELPLMNSDEMREWVSCGHEAGAHTVTHPRLTDLPIEVARKEIRDCKKTIEDIIGGPVGAFCYPHGAYNKDIRALVEAAGYSSATTIAKSRATYDSDKLALPRITVRRTDPALKVLYSCLTA